MKPAHSITKGYPFDIVMSKDRFKNRPIVLLDFANKERILIEVDPIVYPTFKKPSLLAKLFGGKTIDFLLHRLFDYAEALTVAETQVEHLLTDDPFIPEDFGFFKAVGPKTIHDNPSKIYISKHNEAVSIFRNADPEKKYDWRVLVRKTSDSFTETQLCLPNHRIAYAAFYALGIKVEDDGSEL